MVNLKGKNAIVTGAAVGLGNAYAKALAREGVNVAVCDLREEVESLPQELQQSHGVRAVGWRADVSVADDVRRVVDGAIAEFGQIDILVSNAGVWGGSVADDDLDKSLADYDKVVGTNLKGVFLFGRAVIPHMLEHGKGGDIINVSTDHVHTCGTPFHVCPKLPSCPWRDAPRPTSGGTIMDLYDAGKWGIHGLTFAWCKALRPHGIRVNAMCMGATDSNMLRGFHNFNPPPEEVATWMKAEDSAQVVIDLLKEGPQGRTGQNMNFCVGRPVRLEPPLPHVYIREEDVHVQA
jgi:NAD(P)-dependent dehydrogenase (short-subunit alcohol dehydrogenase family)